MNRTRMLAAAFVGALGTAVFAAAAAGAATPKLVASVSDPLHISLTQGGAKFTHLKPGTYTFYCRVHPPMRGVFRVDPA